MSKIYNDPNIPIEVKVGESFAISLKSNPTTGYVWDSEYDSLFVESKSKNFTPISDALGAGGLESFEFKAKKAGSTVITIKHHRPWESMVGNILVFKIQIK